MKSKIPDVYGYDIVIWQRKPDSPTYCAAYTREGEEYIQRFMKSYLRENRVELTMLPEEFFSHLPGDLRIGGINPETKKIGKLTAPPLQ